MSKPISRDLFDQVIALLEAGERNYAEIASKTGTYYNLVKRIACGQHCYQVGLVTRKGMKTKPPLPELERFGSRGKRGQYTPTPKEIALACERIRATWPEERLEAWTPPLVLMSELAAA